jgi:nicotinamidase-related amidase
MKKVWNHLVCETIEEVLHPDRCALLIIDMQNEVTSPDGGAARWGKDITNIVSIIPKCQEMLEAARQWNIPVFHIRYATLPDGRSDSPSWIRTKIALAGTSDAFVEGTWGAEICAELAPRPTEPVITKYRSSAFTGTNLDQFLRANRVETVVIIGEQTPGCVEATYRDAAYHDYYNVLVEDCVAAFDCGLHEASLKVQRDRHDVCMAEQVLAIWRRARVGD